MFRQSIRTLARPVVARRTAVLAVSRTYARGVTQLPLATRALSTTSRISAPAQPSPEGGLDPERLRKLREVEEDILKSANDITADMATAMMGPPELRDKAKAHLNNYAEKVTNDLADALGCKPEDIKRASEEFAKAADVLQKDLETALKNPGDAKAAEKFAKDLTDSASKVSTQSLQLMGFSEKDIKKARDQFAAASEQIREEISGLVQQGKGAVRDELRAQAAVGLAMARFSRDLQRGVSRHKLDKDAERVSKEIRLALDPVARQEQEYKRNTLLWLVAGIALVAGGVYGYKASQPTPPPPGDLRGVRDEIKQSWDNAAQTVSDKESQAYAAAKDAARKAQGTAEDISDSVKDAAQQAKEKARATAIAAENKAKEIVGK